MKKNNLRVLALFLISVLLFTVILLKIQSPRIFPSKETGPFFALSTNRISEIIIFSNEKSSDIIKKDNHWFVKIGNNFFSADEERVNNLITGFISLKKDDLVSTNKIKQKELGIDKQKIIVKENDKAYSLFIGNQVGSTTNYIRVDNEDNVYLSSGFNNAFTPDDYRDLRIGMINKPAEINIIKIKYGISEITLEKKVNDWKIGDKNAKKNRVEYFLNDLRSLKAMDILSAKDLPVYPDLTIVIKDKSNEVKADFFQADPGYYYAKFTNSNYIFKISSVYVNSFKKGDSDFTE